MRHAASTVLALLFPALILLHLLAAPYTKVEESFHIQAVRDILAHGLPRSLELQRASYDHFAFPGAVPRTAIGAAVLAKLSQPVAWLNEGINGQILVLARAILGLFNAFALAVYAHGLRRSFGQPVAVWYILLQGSQFHLLYYASRPLSNMFAFGLTTLSMRYLLPEPIPSARDRSRARRALFLLTVAGVIFRSELALLVATQTIFLLATRRIRLSPDAVSAGLLGLGTAVLATVVIDSQFWQRFPLWPELEAFRFNVVSGQSSAWGTEPWFFYFVNALPRLLLNPLIYLLAIPVALRQPATRQPVASLLVPSLSFVALYSFQPHKEWRFIVYGVPPLTAAAALGAAYLWTRRARSLFARSASHLLAISTLAAFLLSNLVLLPASAANYPGAQALFALQNHHFHSPSPNILPPSTNVSVYLGNLACQTGITRFLQDQAPGWTYDKTEDEHVKSSPAFWDRFDYVLVEAALDPNYRDNDEVRLRHALPGSEWETVLVVDGFAGLSVLRPGSPATGVVERKVLQMLGGGRAVETFDAVREYVREVLLRGWWVEVRMRPKIKVLRRVKGI
ncbi:hypothetical protein NUU61_008064 [Penicillium alfredii]|uniref:Mannosyltransferase n=1 Tax=Penicillium alfredii TaxID=1506179 RepID=A0A9W9ERQ7_9EURO|nr:uncharacterized protein NUU61_008064 [Penicillium alfredii]KAJ5086757.1 hypothetical protein NUU61_008064 [Penicillium alfredii]